MRCIKMIYDNINNYCDSDCDDDKNIYDNDDCLGE